MVWEFSLHDAQAIAATLRGELRVENTTWTIEQRSQAGVLQQLVSIHPRIEHRGENVTLVTVQSRQGYSQLFGCCGYLTIEPDEILFVARTREYFSCLLVGAERTCTCFAHVPISLLRVRLDELDPAVLLAVMQLSLAEQLLVADAGDEH